VYVCFCFFFSPLVGKHFNDYYAQGKKK
jgi:hypothetical protein